MKKKAIVAVVALVLVLCCAMGGTLAWLIDTSGPVVNTFKYGDINIELWENDYLPNSNTLDTNKKVASESDYKMVPGNSMPKNPTVTVKKGSEACWLFVKVEKSSNFDTFMTCSVNTAENEWKELSSAASGNYKVYYREVAATTADTNFAVLKDNTVSVKKDVTKDKLNALEEGTMPTLTFTVYAIQSANLTNADNTEANTAAEAWALIEQ